MSTIAIIGAMDEEVANIASALSDITVTEEAGVSVTRGTIETNKGTRVNVAATVGGMGTVNIAATTQHLIDADQPDAVIFSGIAGNLNTHLHINDVVLGGTLRYLDTDMRLVGQWKPGTADQPVEEFHSDDRLIEVADKVLTDLNVHHITGIIATGNYFVDGPKKVEQVIRETGADAVEMEGAVERQCRHGLRGIQGIRHFRICRHCGENRSEYRQAHVSAARPVQRIDCWTGRLIFRYGESHESELQGNFRWRTGIAYGNRFREPLLLKKNDGLSEG